MIFYQSEATGWTWAGITLDIPRVIKSQITTRPSLHPTAKSVPLLLNAAVTASETQSNTPSYSYVMFFKKQYKNEQNYYIIEYVFVNNEDFFITKCLTLYTLFNKCIKNSFM